MINTLHTILVISFVAVTAVLLSMTLMQRLRIRGVCMTWRSGKIGSLPIWPTLFMGIVAVFLVYAQNTIESVSLTVFIGYFAGGMLWFFAVALSSTVVVTDYGMIPEAGRSGEAVGWRQISDYFEVQEEKRVHFTFLYQDYFGERKRLDLVVPFQEVDRFRSILRAKLDSQFEETVERVMARRALEN